MKLEIEAKLKVDSPGVLSERLQQAGAVFKCDVVERDSYFIDTDRVIVKNGCGLRLRKQSIGNDEKYILTYKGPKQQSRFKSRQEAEVCVSDIKTTEDLLSAIGCRKKLEFEKKRSIWTFMSCSISLDRLPLLGRFIEVEGPDEATITRVLQKLGLADTEHISKGYARLMADKLDELGTGNREVFFENYD